jgi:predicted nucleic acid-binding protein
MKAVIDANVIVSAMLNPDGSPAKVVDKLFEN